MSKNGKVRKELLIRTDEMSVLRWLAQYKGVDVATLMHIYIRDQIIREIQLAKLNKWPLISPTVQRIIEKW